MVTDRLVAANKHSTRKHINLLIIEQIKSLLVILMMFPYHHNHFDDSILAMWQPEAVKMII